VVSVVLFEQRRSKRTKVEEIEKMAELRFLRTKLSELEDTYKKQKALLESGKIACYSQLLEKSDPKTNKCSQLITICIRLARWYEKC
jgi:hypothetical protein